MVTATSDSDCVYVDFIGCLVLWYSDWYCAHTNTQHLERAECWQLRIVYPIALFNTKLLVQLCACVIDTGSQLYCMHVL